jgi:dienelactone hydrolase
LFGGGVLLVAICVGAIAWMLRPPSASPEAYEPFAYSEIALPAFPSERGEPTPVEANEGVQFYQICLGEQGGYYEQPGMGGMIWLLLPAGEHPPQSLPALLIAASRLGGDKGSTLKNTDPREFVPYLQAGCAVIVYELDGPNVDLFDDEKVKRSFEAFRNSRAGLVNGRNALEYALQKVPEINPNQVYALGFSYEGAHALLLAEHEPRLTGVLAIEPRVDLVADTTPLILSTSSAELPGYVDLLTKASPKTHFKRLKMPVFLFHADAEKKLVSIHGVPEFAQQLKKQGTDVTFTVLKTPIGGDWKAGRDAGFEWLRERGAIK